MIDWWDVLAVGGGILVGAGIILFSIVAWGRPGGCKHRQTTYLGATIGGTRLLGCKDCGAVIWDVQ